MLHGGSQPWTEHGNGQKALKDQCFSFLRLQKGGTPLKKTSLSRSSWENESDLTPLSTFHCKQNAICLLAHSQQLGNLSIISHYCMNDGWISY